MSEAIASNRGAAGTAVVSAFPTMRWSAVFGGWLVATGIAFIMYVLGLAVGFSAVDATDLEADASSMGIGTGIWLVLTWAVSLFLGGMFASWLDGTPDRSVGALHGIAVWALATTVSVLMVAIGFSNILQGGASLLRGGAALGAAAAGAAGRQGASMPDSATAMLQAQLKQQVAQAMARSAQGGGKAQGPSQPAGGNSGSPPSASVGAGDQASSQELRRAMEQIDAETTAGVATALVRGDVEGAKARLAAGTTLSQAEVDEVVQGMSSQVEQARTRAREAADRAAGYTSAVMWTMFASSLIALIAAAFGGWMGGANMRRVYG